MASLRCYHNLLLVLFLCTFCLLTLTSDADSTLIIGTRLLYTELAQPWWNSMLERIYQQHQQFSMVPFISQVGMDIYIYAVKACDEYFIWKQNFENLTGIILPSSFASLNINSTVSRSSPTIAGNLLIFGLYWPGVVIAVKRSTGELVWIIQVETHFASFITMSGTYYKGSYYIGTSSLEEGATIDQCCTSRGSLVKLGSKSCKILWKTYMLPNNFNKTGGYIRAAIWGKQPNH